LNYISLTLGPGAYGLLGPNGSGKTTLLNLLTGQLRPTIGTVRTLGLSPRNNATLYRQIGYCPGSEGLYASVSGYDWVCYLMRLHGMSAKDARRAAVEALQTVGMVEAMHRPIARYSRGMRQRVKLAQAIAHDPQFLILDEPFNGLDPVGRHEMSVALRDWIGRGKSLLLASHLLHEVESITHSFLLICGGRLLASGTAEDVFQLLANVPSEVTLRCSDPHRLAALLVDRRVANSLTIDDHTVTVATHQPSQLATELPGWLAETGVEVTEMHSANESLQALFDSLMKIHRGEL
jgi:ABC-2 type transport system ATP-binding protein